VSRRNSLRRRKATIIPRRLFVVLCEGANTEPGYINELAQHQKLAPLILEIESAAGVPLTMAKKAVAKVKKLPRNKARNLSSFERHDEVWVVFDKDEHPKIKEALDLCYSNKIGVAFSNPCFEVWLILHFQDYDKSDGREAAQKHCEKICAGYSRKGKKPEFTALLAQVEKAEKRAVQQQQRRKDEGDALGAPSTTVFQLVQAMRRVKD